MQTRHLTPDTRHLLNGLLIIDKPTDWTSHDVVAKVRGICRTRRVGHTGTLDPFATGVLVVCLNQATRLVQFLTGDDKEYIATVRFGFATDTGDLTGSPIGEMTDPTHLNKDIIEAALPHLRGNIQQIPPMYSAKKIGGVKLYEMARRGEVIERQPINIQIKEFELIEKTNNDCWKFRVSCTSGTYIRTLAEDLGKYLKVGAHLNELRRTKVGKLSINEAITLEQLAELSISNVWNSALIPMNKALTLPILEISDEDAARLRNGRAVMCDSMESLQTTYQLFHHGLLVGIGEYDAKVKQLKPKIVMNNE